MTGGNKYKISRDDWSLHRKGEIDRQRHQEKVKEAIKKDLADIVSEESIIMSDGNKVIKVPIRSLDEYHFRFDQGKQKHAGHGDGRSRVGDSLGGKSPGRTGAGKGAADEPGVDYYEAEITIDELAEMIFDDLGLPHLERRKNPKLSSESVEFKDVRKKGISSNIDRKRTIMECIKRNALSGKTGLGAITPEDLRYRTWEITQKYDSNAVVLAMMDTSGSMGNYEKYLARSFFYWMVRFLRTKYKDVQIVFLSHHVEARETNEEEFFTRGIGGGTRCSSVYKLGLELIEQRYNPADYNIYAFHFSDGDNLFSDNALCLSLIMKLLEVCNMVGYGEIENSSYHNSTLYSVYQKIDHQRFVATTLRDRSGVYKALKDFFKIQREAV